MNRLLRKERKTSYKKFMILSVNHSVLPAKKILSTLKSFSLRNSHSSKSLFSQAIRKVLSLESLQLFPLSIKTEADESPSLKLTKKKIIKLEVRGDRVAILRVLPASKMKTFSIIQILNRRWLSILDLSHKTT